MPELNTISLPIRDALIAILRDRRINSGHWEIGINFRHAGVTASINNERALPTMMVQVEDLIITQVPQPTDLSVDASALPGIVIAPAIFPSELNLP